MLLLQHPMVVARARKHHKSSIKITFKKVYLIYKAKKKSGFFQIKLLRLATRSIDKLLICIHILTRKEFIYLFFC